MKRTRLALFLAADATSPVSVPRQQAGSCVVVPDAEVAAAQAGLGREMTAMVAAVRAEAPGARIVLVDDPTVLSRRATQCAVMPIPQDRLRVLLEVARKLSRTTERVARRTGSDFVAASELSRRHGVCSANPWMTGYDLTPGRPRCTSTRPGARRSRRRSWRS